MTPTFRHVWQFSLWAVARHVTIFYRPKWNYQELWVFSFWTLLGHLLIMFDINIGGCKIDDKVSFWIDGQLKHFNFFNQLFQISLHFIWDKLWMFVFGTMPTPQFFISLFDFSLILCRSCELFLQILGIIQRWVNCFCHVLILSRLYHESWLLFIFIFFYSFFYMFFHFWNYKWLFNDEEK